MTTIKHILKQSQTLLGETRSSEVLLAHVLKQSREYLYTYPEKVLNENDIDSFKHLIHRYSIGEPIAYLLGEKEFYSLNFKVTPDTLVPRPETELLVDQTLLLIPENTPLTILELGVGSGAVAITLAKLRPQVQMLATDISENALAVAKENATHHAVNNMTFLLSNWFESIPAQKFNIIISNPPYVAENDPHLEALRFEPLSALHAGEFGLDCLKKIILSVPDYLLPEGWLLVEHGFDQKEAVQALFKKARLSEINTLHDLAGLPRVTVGQFAA